MTKIENAVTPDTEMLVKKLVGVLADTYVLAVKIHGYHWNVTGKQFLRLHEFFQGQYEGLFDAADEIAERIRALGMMPDGSMEAFLKNTVLKEAEAKPLSAEDMLADVYASHQKVRERIAEAADVADEIDDVGTEDLMVGRLREHDKTLWMLRSMLA